MGISSFDKLSTKTKLSFVTAGFGQNALITFVNTFFMTYLIGGVKLSTAGIAIVTTIMTVAKVWDAINDPLMGIIVDKTQTRWGKLRPFIIFSALPVALFTILMFSVPNMAENYQIIYIAIAYVMWGMAYTICDVPFWGLAGSLTQNIDERTKLISFTRTVGTIAMGLITLGAPIIANALGGGGETTSAKGWTYTAIIIAILGMAMFTMAFFGTKETVSVKSTATVKQTFINMVKNKPLFMAMLTGILGFGRSIIQVGGPVIAFVVFGDESKFIILGAFMVVSMIVATIITPFLLKKITKKALMQWTNILSVVVYVIMFIVGYNNFWLVASLIFIEGLFTGAFIVLQTAMVADSVDYLQVVTGERNEGICFAGLTFSGQVMGAVATLAFGMTVFAVNYSAGVVITETIKNGLYLGMTIIPAVSCLISVIPMIFYTLTEDKLAKMLTDYQAKQTQQE